MNPPASLFLHKVRPTDPADRTITIHYWCQSASLISGDKIPRQLFSHHFQLAIGRHLNYICNGGLCSSGILKTQLVKVTWVHPTSSLRPLGETNDAPVVVNVATGGYRLFFFFFRGLLKWGCERRDVGVLGIWTALLGDSVADAPTHKSKLLLLSTATPSLGLILIQRGVTGSREMCWVQRSGFLSYLQHHIASTRCIREALRSSAPGTIQGTGQVSNLPDTQVSSHARALLSQHAH